MSNNRSHWRRVTRGRVCPICRKPDWCMVAVDESAAICSRVESTKPTGRAGWVHQMYGGDWQRPTWRAVRRCESSKPSVNMLEIAKHCCRSLRTTSLAWLANELSLSMESLKLLRVGWSERWKAFSFPMREPNGNVCGIRYRAYSGSKFSEMGSREGLFYCPRKIKRDGLLIVEGASDAAAAMDVGFSSVVGRANCIGNVEQVLTLCRRLQPRQVSIIPDNDPPGIDGASKLQAAIDQAGGTVRLLQLPEGVKDVRQCIQETKNAEWLRGQLGILCGTSTSNMEATKSDNSNV